MIAPYLSLAADGVRLQVRVQPRASHNRLVGLRGDALKLQVTAPPVEGEANAAVIRLLASIVGVPQSAVQVVGGAKSRDKFVEIQTADPTRVATRVAELLARCRSGSR
jgi:uncharacterized protein (TIGR00251 family)